jgi:hypothetical protein
MRKHPAHKERAQERKRCIKAKKTGWRPHVLSVLDALSAQRREMEDRLGLEDRMLKVVARGPAAFGDLVAATRLPAVARAHALHLLWHRRLGTGLASPFGDRSLVWLARRPG